MSSTATRQFYNFNAENAGVVRSTTDAHVDYVQNTDPAFQVMGGVDIGGHSIIKGKMHLKQETRADEDVLIYGTGKQLKFQGTGSSALFEGNDTGVIFSQSNENGRIELKGLNNEIEVEGTNGKIILGGSSSQLNVLGTTDLQGLSVGKLATFNNLIQSTKTNDANSTTASVVMDGGLLVKRQIHVKANSTYELGITANGDTDNQNMSLTGNGRLYTSATNQRTDGGSTVGKAAIETKGGFASTKIDGVGLWLSSADDNSVTSLGGFVFNSETDSTSAINGAGVVAGGLGVGKKVHVGEEVHVHGNTQSTTKHNGALVVEGGAGISMNLNVGGAAVFGSSLDVEGDITATSGNLTVGVGSTTLKTLLVQNEAKFDEDILVEKNVVVKGDMEVQGTLKTSISKEILTGDNFITTNSFTTSSAWSSGGEINVQKVVGGQTANGLTAIWYNSDSQWKISYSGLAALDGLAGDDFVFLFDTKSMTPTGDVTPNEPNKLNGLYQVHSNDTEAKVITLASTILQYGEFIKVPVGGEGEGQEVTGLTLSHVEIFVQSSSDPSLSDGSVFRFGSGNSKTSFSWKYAEYKNVAPNPAYIEEPFANNNIIDAQTYVATNGVAIGVGSETLLLPALSNDEAGTQFTIVNDAGASLKVYHEGDSDGTSAFLGGKGHIVLEYGSSLKVTSGLSSKYHIM